MYIKLAMSMFGHKWHHSCHNLVSVPKTPADYNHSGHSPALMDNLEQQELCSSITCCWSQL
jgi:hypothetical protein